jgi:hypothetical protein
MRRAAIIASAVAASLSSDAETLEDAWNAAIAANGRLSASTSRAIASEEALTAARAERLPNVALTTATSVWRDTPGFDFTGSRGSAASNPCSAERR